MSDISKIKKGDWVQIANGDWYYVQFINNGNVAFIDKSQSATGSGISISLTSPLITSHRPASEPEPKTDGDEWLTLEDVQSYDENAYWFLSHTNRVMNKKYGTPEQFRARVEADVKTLTEELLKQHMKQLADLKASTVSKREVARVVRENVHQSIDPEMSDYVDYNYMWEDLMQLGITPDLATEGGRDE